MCIVIAGVGSAVPTRNELKVACSSNPDGFGWAIVSSNKDGKHLTVKRSMIGAIAIDTFLDKMSQLGDSVVAWTFHARIYTHGQISLANTHPFYVGNDKTTVLAHNGILPVTIKKGDTRSDTRVFAEDYLPEIGGILGLNNRVRSELVEGFVYGSNSKVVILTAHPDAEYALIIFGESSGHWRKAEIWFSNRSYEPYVSWSEKYGKGYESTFSKNTSRYDQFTAGGFNADLGAIKANLLTKKEADDAVMYIRCSNKVCDGLIEEGETICPKCDQCQDCEYDKMTCMCWQPSMSARERADASMALANEERSF